MFGFVGAGGQAANTSSCSPAGCQVICEESNSWSMYATCGSVEPFGALGLRRQVMSILKTRVLRSVGWSFGPVEGQKGLDKNGPSGLPLMLINEGSTFSGTKPSRCDRISSTITVVLFHTKTCSMQIVGTFRMISSDAKR